MALANVIPPRGALTSLYTTDSPISTGNANLSESMENFDFLILRAVTNYEEVSMVVPMPMVKNTTIISTQGSEASDSGTSTYPRYRASLQLTKSSVTQFTVDSRYNNSAWKLSLKEVIGVKL